MVTVSDLVELGFKQSQAEQLMAKMQKSPSTRYHAYKSKSEFEKILQGIQTAYDATRQQAAKAVLTYPQFAGLDHERVLQGIETAYNATRPEAAKAVLTHPPFAYRNHERVLRDIETAYNATRPEAAKAVLTHPPFAGLNHERVLQGIQTAYNATREQAAKAVLSNPRFAGLNHERILRQGAKVGKVINLNREQVAQAILTKPMLGSYSWRRNIASIDAIRRALERTGVQVTPLEMFQWYRKKSTKSPYALEGSKLREARLEKRGEASSSKMGKAAETWLKRRKAAW